MKKEKLIKYLDKYLKIKDFEDNSKNGLQVDNSKKEIKKIGYSVDIATYIIDQAKYQEVDLILSHHGIFWGHEEVLTGVPYKRAKDLIKDDICVYACHLPLDAHSEVGNNIGLLKAFVRIFGLQENDYKIEKIGNYKGQEVGYGIKSKKEIHISNIVTPYAEQMQLIKRLFNFGNKNFINSIAFISGGAGELVKEINEKSYDLLITGEMSHSEIILSKELEQSVLLGGHRETEKIGPKLLAYHLRDKFDIEIVFLDEKY